eukprot:47935-Chlamydomonas_euryale.AAC.2
MCEERRLSQHMCEEGACVNSPQVRSSLDRLADGFPRMLGKEAECTLKTGVALKRDIYRAGEVHACIGACTGSGTSVCRVHAWDGAAGWCHRMTR